jgi:hypothetical protein
MERIVPEALALLQLLLPGFLAAWVFYAFTSYRKPKEFERIIQALIFTLLVKGGLSIVRASLLLAGKRFSIGQWSTDVELLWSILLAFLLGILFSYLANTDHFHKLIRKLGITRETSFPSEWFGAFLKNITYVVLQMKDGRRIYGWPMDWPSTPNMGYFTLRDASWLDKDNKEIPIKGVSCILINSEDVQWVEFMEKTWEKSNVDESPKSTTTEQAATVTI